MLEQNLRKSVSLDASRVAPQISWGTNPAMTCNVDEAVPDPAEYAREITQDWKKMPSLPSSTWTWKKILQ